MAAQGQGKGEAAAGGMRTPLLGDVHTDSSQMPHSDAGKAKKNGKPARRRGGGRQCEAQ
jgi:hypothetical protein